MTLRQIKDNERRGEVILINERRRPNDESNRIEAHMLLYAKDHQRLY